MAYAAIGTHAAALSLVSAMITPGILILAAGSLITSTITRLARVTDRTRYIIDKLNHAVAQGETAHAVTYARWLAQYAKRSVVIEKALLAFYLSIALFVASTLAIALSNILEHAYWLPTALVVAGISVVLLGTAALIWETSAGAGMVRQEIANSSVALVECAEKEALMRMTKGPT